MDQGEGLLGGLLLDDDGGRVVASMGACRTYHRAPQFPLASSRCAEHGVVAVAHEVIAPIGIAGSGVAEEGQQAANVPLRVVGGAAHQDLRYMRRGRLGYLSSPDSRPPGRRQASLSCASSWTSAASCPGRSSPGLPLQDHPSFSHSLCLEEAGRLVFQIHLG